VASLPLAVGDSLLFVGTSEQISLLREIGDFVVLTTNPSDLPLHKKKAIPVIVVFAIAVMASIFGFPIYLSVLSAGLIIILGKIISIDDIYHAIPWQTIFTIIGMASVSTAIIETGLAARIGTLLQPVSTLGLPVLAIAMYVFSGVITQVIGGQVAALVIGPIAITSAIQAGVNPYAIAVATAIGCSATFILPLSHPVILLMINPGNYDYQDFFKIGIWLTLLCMLVLYAAMFLFW
jgi:di/tricarboxylate transporter